MQRCLATFGVVAVTRIALDAAFVTDGRDFEDDVQANAAHEAQLDAIVTRDPSGFVRSPVRALSPAEFTAQLP